MGYIKRGGYEIFDPHFWDSFYHYVKMMEINYVLGQVLFLKRIDREVGKAFFKFILLQTF